MFKLVPLRRGFEEIKIFFDLCQKYNAYICGGYARYCASPLPTSEVVLASDVDMFSQSEESLENILNELLILGFSIKVDNDVCITLEADKEKEAIAWLPRPQIIKPVFTVGKAEDILSNFDFTVVRASILSSTIVIVDEDFEEDEKKQNTKN